MLDDELDSQQADLERIKMRIVELQRTVSKQRQEGLKEIAEMLGQAPKEHDDEGS